VKHAAVIVNPIAGRGKAAPRAERLAASLSAAGIEAEIHPTAAAGDAAALAAALAPRADVLAVVGGDGTLNEVVNGVGAERVPLAFVPCGTANVVAGEFGLPRDPEPVAAAIVAGRTRRVDAIRFGERRLIMMAGAGFDGAVVEDLAARRTGPITMGTYVPCIARTFWRYGFPQIRVRVDGREVESAATAVVVANVAGYGGPFSLTPDARPDDGVLDVCAMRPTGRIGLAAVLAAAFARLLPRMRSVAYYRGTEVALEADDRVALQGDGDPAGTLPATFRVEPGAIDLIVPEET
jgi:YegS/Rv2252/BmrU family lipid kinase